MNLQPSPASSSPPEKSARPRGRWLAIAAFAVVGLVGTLVVRHKVPVATQAQSTTNEAPASLAEALGGGDDFAARNGPWGELKFVRITVERPDEFISLPVGPAPEVVWDFAGYQPAQVRELFQRAKLPAPVADALSDQRRWQVGAAGVKIAPPPDLIAQLSRDARAVIYGALGEFPQNSAQFHAFRYRRERLEEWFDRSDLSDATEKAMRGLLYPQGDAECFADYFEVIDRLPTNAEKRRFLKTLTRESTLLVEVKISPATDTKAMAAYWGKEGRAKDIVPLLESLRRVPGGAELDVAHLLPPMARQRLYTYPFPSEDQVELKRDCTWTALNFFDETPDDRFCDPKEAMAQLHSKYYPIKDTPTFGDVICLLGPDNRILHSAVYIADRIVFTKNGGYFSQPWLLMDFRDMVARYSNARGLEVRAYRLKRD